MNGKAYIMGNNGKMKPFTLIYSTLFLANARKSVDKTFKKSFIKNASREKGFAKMGAPMGGALCILLIPEKNKK